MQRSIGELELADAAEAAAGNWKRFDSFVWRSAADLSDADEWAIFYTHHRESGLLDLSNRRVIAATLHPYTEGDDPDVTEESHSHWAVGWIDGFAVRVTRNGSITEAFKAYHRLAEKLAIYPVLDEHDYSTREYEATFENVSDAARTIADDYSLPDGWEGEVYDWLLEHDPGEIENRDDQGGYPSETAIRSAFEALGYEPLAQGS